MSKKYKLIILITFFSLVLYLLITRNRITDINNVIRVKDNPPTISELNPIDSKNEINFDGYIFDYNWFYVSNLDKLILLPNWDQKRTSDEMISEENCLYLSSAGFYSKDEKPIGLFSIGNIIYSNFSGNNLFNGIFSKISEKEYVFSQNPLRENTLFSLQSGPLIIFNFKLKLFDNLSEGRGRRNIIISTKENKLLFITIYNKNSIFDGPKLGDLPKIIDLISKNHNWNIENALNLDGGTASSFKNDDIYLKELSPVGSFFCVRNYKSSLSLL